MHSASPLLQVENLSKHFKVARPWGASRAPRFLTAVDRVSFDVRPGEVLGLVGESGCGKSTLGRMILRLTEPSAGRIVFEGRDLLTAAASDMRATRRHMQIVFQDPFSSLDPRMIVERIIAEPFRIHEPRMSTQARRARVEELLDLVGLKPHHATLYPHEFSGGQRQRIAIARAIALNPRLIVCDEPVSALDVSVQAQIINLLRRLQSTLGLAYIFVSHDLRVVRHISDRTAVMYLGRIVELADKSALFSKPLHPYTRALLEAVPNTDPTNRKPLNAVTGEIPSVLSPPPGCRFHTRCPFAQEMCRRVEPQLAEIRPGHHVACHFAADFLDSPDAQQIGRRTDVKLH